MTVNFMEDIETKEFCSIGNGFPGEICFKFYLICKVQSTSAELCSSVLDLTETSCLRQCQGVVINDQAIFKGRPDTDFIQNIKC